MSYSISLSGHGAEQEDVREIFENAVRALRAVSADPPGGSLWASDEAGQNGINVTAADVEDLADGADDGDEPTELAGPDTDDGADEHEEH